MERETQSKVLVGFGAVVLLAIVLYFGLGMPGMDHGASVATMDHSSSTSAEIQGKSAQGKVQVLDAEGFAARMNSEPVALMNVLMNVHVPFEGDIEDTDLSIPFDQIGSRVTELPTDRDTPLLVYCQTGRMSKIATAELIRLGYRNVSDLDGGMLAWKKSGREVIGIDQ